MTYYTGWTDCEPRKSVMSVHSNNGFLSPMQRVPQSGQRLLRSRDVAEIDSALLIAIGVLVFSGLIMVYSASISMADARTHGVVLSYFFVRQAVFLVVAVCVCLCSALISMQTWQRLAPFLFMMGLALLLLVLTPGVGRVVNGSRRWLPMGIIHCQPSELMKSFVVLYAADYAVRKARLLDDFRSGFLPMAVVMLFVGLLLLREPDFGSFVVIIGTAFGILFLAGLNIRLLIMLVVFLTIAFASIIFFSHYRRVRLFYFINPWADEWGHGYQLVHALIAFGRGGLTGVGLGASVEKLFYLPEAYSDFLIAVIAEELGFVGITVVLCTMGFVIYRILDIGRCALLLGCAFSGLVAYGIGIWLGIQSIVNCGVNMGLLPTKGLTMPLMSYGGSAILAYGVTIGLVLRVDWENRLLLRTNQDRA